MLLLALLHAGRALIAFVSDGLSSWSSFSSFCCPVRPPPQFSKAGPRSELRSIVHLRNPHHRDRPPSRWNSIALLLLPLPQLPRPNVCDSHSLCFRSAASPPTHDPRPTTTYSTRENQRAERGERTEERERGFGVGDVLVFRFLVFVFYFWFFVFLSFFARSEPHLGPPPQASGPPLARVYGYCSPHLVSHLDWVFRSSCHWCFLPPMPRIRPPRPECRSAEVHSQYLIPNSTAASTGYLRPPYAIDGLFSWSIEYRWDYQSTTNSPPS